MIQDSDCRIGVPFIPIPAEKIAAIVITQSSDSASTVEPPDAETNAIAGHLSATAIMPHKATVVPIAH
ncbi:hypothetical protein [Rhizobium leguminosarum]|uniref:hypothetical protein n=1 Tax=Rhizobium leguminosarum TaxID=384 RepID=UPI00143F32C4|nr:hypothetical protein [Rhizobium leguminosarum]NKL23623.1 hypothetical protein [Rhizobium leguminosarum bv. viciae]